MDKLPNVEASLQQDGHKFVDSAATWATEIRLSLAAIQTNTSHRLFESPILNISILVVSATFVVFILTRIQRQLELMNDFQWEFRDSWDEQTGRWDGDRDRWDEQMDEIRHLAHEGQRERQEDQERFIRGVFTEAARQQQQAGRAHVHAAHSSTTNWMQPQPPNEPEDEPSASASGSSSQLSQAERLQNLTRRREPGFWNRIGANTTIMTYEPDGTVRNTPFSQWSVDRRRLNQEDPNQEGDGQVGLDQEGHDQESHDHVGLDQAGLGQEGVDHDSDNPAHEAEEVRPKERSRPPRRGKRKNKAARMELEAQNAANAASAAGESSAPPPLGGAPGSPPWSRAPSPPRDSPPPDARPQISNLRGSSQPFVPAAVRSGRSSNLNPAATPFRQPPGP